MDMQRYLLVLDTDLAVGKELDLQPADTLLLAGPPGAVRSSGLVAG